jgi:hypothetical protein
LLSADWWFRNKPCDNHFGAYVLRISWTDFEGKRCRRAALSANAAERIVFGEHLLDACFVEANAYGCFRPPRRTVCAGARRKSIAIRVILILL